MTITTRSEPAPTPGAGLGVTNRTTARGPCRRRRFTVVEIVCVFGLLGMMFAAMASLLSFNIWVRDNLNRQLAATNLARSRLEHMRVAPFAELMLYEERDVQVNSAGVADPKGGYFRNTTVGSEYARSRPVTVYVRCAGRLGKPGFQMSLATVITNADATSN